MFSISFPAPPRLRLTRCMSSVSSEAVQRAQVWWRDSGAAFAKTKRSYTVDAWGRRRGGSTQGGKSQGNSWKNTENMEKPMEKILNG